MPPKEPNGWLRDKAHWGLPSAVLATLLALVGPPIYSAAISPISPDEVDRRIEKELLRAPHPWDKERGEVMQRLAQAEKLATDALSGQAELGREAYSLNLKVSTQLAELKAQVGAFSDRMKQIDTRQQATDSKLDEVLRRLPTR